MSGVLDKIDRAILGLLQQNAELSTADIAERVGISQSPCWRRIKRLEESGMIRGRVCQLDRHKLGLSVLVFAHVKLAVHDTEALPLFETTISQYDEVLECHTLLGHTDYMLKIVVEDVAAYERFYRDHLSHMPQVRETNSMIVMSEIKNTTALPLRERR